jgi:hypothetical protein
MDRSIEMDVSNLSEYEHMWFVTAGKSTRSIRHTANVHTIAQYVRGTI